MRCQLHPSQQCTHHLQAYSLSGAPVSKQLCCTAGNKTWCCRTDTRSPKAVPVQAIEETLIMLTVHVNACLSSFLQYSSCTTAHSQGTNTTCAGGHQSLQCPHRRCIHNTACKHCAGCSALTASAPTRRSPCRTPPCSTPPCWVSTSPCPCEGPASRAGSRRCLPHTGPAQHTGCCRARC